MPRVDYDRIARQYDKPSRDHDVDSGLIAFRDETPSVAASELRILDLAVAPESSCSPTASRFPTRPSWEPIRPSGC